MPLTASATPGATLIAITATQGSLTAASAGSVLSASSAPSDGMTAGLQDQALALIFDQAGSNIT